MPLKIPKHCFQGKYIKMKLILLQHYRDEYTVGQIVHRQNMRDLSQILVQRIYQMKLLNRELIVNCI